MHSPFTPSLDILSHRPANIVLIPRSEVLGGLGHLPQRVREPYQVPSEILCHLLRPVAVALLRLLNPRVVLVPSVRLGVADCGGRGIGGRHADRRRPANVPLDRRGGGGRGFLARVPLSPQQIGLHVMQHVVDLEQVYGTKQLLDPVFWLLVMLLGTCRVVLVAHFQIHQATRDQNRLVHRVDALHELLHQVQDAVIGEFRVVVASDATKTIPGRKEKRA